MESFSRLPPRPSGHAHGAPPVRGKVACSHPIVGNLVRYPVDELEAWKRANDARLPPIQRSDRP